MRKVLVAVAASCLVLASAVPASADPGDLDDAWGDQGRAIVDLSQSLDDQAVDIAVDHEGRVLVAAMGVAPDARVIRFRNNGTPDTSFSGDGWAFVPLTAIPAGVGVAPDGGPLLGGASAEGSFFVAKFREAGGRDLSFGTEGIGEIDAPGTGGYEANGFAVGPGGRMAVVGAVDTADGQTFVVAMFTKRGLPDESFGGDGIVVTDVGPGNDMAVDAAFQADGMLVVAGRSQDGSGSTRFAVVRYKPGGGLDRSFSGDGKAFADVTDADDFAQGMVIDDGRIVVVGGSEGSSSDLELARFEPGGALDGTFSGDGLKTVDGFADTDVAFDVDVDNHGRYVVAAGVTLVSSFGLAVARVRSGGATDLSFGSDGVALSGLLGRGLGVLARPGKVLVAGFEDTASGNDTAVVRWLA